MNTNLPKFASAKKLKELFGISRTFLRSLVLQGYVRTVKHSDAKQSARLYNVEDLEKVFDRMSMGKRPRRRA